MGALLYLAARTYRTALYARRGFSVFLCLAGVLMVWAAYAWTDVHEPLDCIYSPSLVGLGAFLFILGGLHLRSFESRYLKVLALPGKYSYAIYLFHGLIYYEIYSPFLEGREIFSGFLIFVVVCTAAAAVSYRFFEIPANRLIRRLFGVKSPVVA